MLYSIHFTEKWEIAHKCTSLFIPPWSPGAMNWKYDVFCNSHRI